jgi:predicted dehydrogenase
MNHYMPELRATSRRHFLRRSLQTTAVMLAAPEFIPARVFAKANRPGANDRIGIGFIGIGRQASGLLQVIQGQPVARYVAVADVNLPRAQASAQKHGATAYQDYRRVLERKDVDAIVTATPEQWRGPICIHSCQAGKHVYAEKPLTLTIREGRLMVKAARKYNCVFQVGSQQRSTWPNYAGCELVRTGRIGKIHRVIAVNYPSPWEYGLPAQPIPAGLDWDMWCGPADLVPYHTDLYQPRANPGWLSFRLFSGGEMTGWGAHGLDQIQCALGMDDSGPVEIWTEGGPFVPLLYQQPENGDRGNRICSQPRVFFRYAGDITVELSMEWGKGLAGGAVFMGDKGKITIDRGRCESDPAELAEEALIKRPQGFNENHQLNWLDCIRSGQRPIADVETGHRSSTVCHLGNIARRLGRRLRWDPVKEEFIGDREANQLLDRPRRKPWELPTRI